MTHNRIYVIIGGKQYSLNRFHISSRMLRKIEMLQYDIRLAKKDLHFLERNLLSAVKFIQKSRDPEWLKVRRAVLAKNYLNNKPAYIQRATQWQKNNPIKVKQIQQTYNNKKLKLSRVSTLKPLSHEARDNP